MEIYLPICGLCIEKQHFDNFQSNHEYHFHELNEDSTIETECRNGHKTIYALSQLKFELLFNFGVSSLFDGNKRASFLNFCGSLEEFYKFFLKVIFNHNEEKSLQNCLTKLSNILNEFLADSRLYTFIYGRKFLLFLTQLIKNIQR